MHITEAFKNLGRRLIASSLVGVMLTGIILPVQAAAVVSQPNATPRISFTFDDGLASAYTAAAPTLAKYGLTGTNYVISGCVGMTTVPNTCHADTNRAYMSWTQVTALQNTYGWEIGAHTATHPYLASSDAGDGQPNVLTPAQVDSELSQSKATFASHGINVTDFASPYGDYNNTVLASVAKYYASHRGFADQNNNVWAYNDYLINDYQVQAGVTVAQVKAKIDAAITGNNWLVLTFHEIRSNPSTDPNEYMYSTSDLDQIAAYVKAKQDAGALRAVNINKGLVTSDINFLANSTFDSGIASGWTTDTPANVTKDTANNGSYPSATNSIKLVGGATPVHLFTPNVNVDAAKTYLLKNFLNVKTRTSGEVGFYMDEYDASGNWISGQWKKAEPSTFVEEIAFTYKPTSTNVKQARLQVYVTANSGITAYVDNFQWFALDGSGPTTTTPPPSNTVNIMPNSTFDNGIADGWRTDNASAFAVDSNNNGSPANPAKSIKMTAQAGNAHLFSPQVAVTSTVTYTIKPYVKVASIVSGEVGFYIDEYDANGAWLSGKYFSGPRTVSAGDVTYNYQPTSVNVKKASLQVILPANSGINGYFDNAQWLAPSGTTTPPPAPTPVTVFEDSFATGFSKGWTTDSATTITADASGNGGSDQPTNSVKFVATAANTHLFSPKVAVTSGKTYTLSQFLKVTALSSGEVGFYVDEYDANGNWVSGKYLSGVRAAGSQTLNLTYTPSSANVAKASLQVIITGNSGITGYYDSVKWTTPS